jgi:hypothetical protein
LSISDTLGRRREVSASPGNQFIARFFSTVLIARINRSLFFNGSHRPNESLAFFNGSRSLFFNGSHRPNESLAFSTALIARINHFTTTFTIARSRARLLVQQSPLVHQSPLGRRSVAARSPLSRRTVAARSPHGRRTVAARSVGHARSPPGSQRFAR